MYAFFIFPGMSEWYKTKIFCRKSGQINPLPFNKQRNRSGKAKLGFNTSFKVIWYAFFILPSMSEWYKTKIFCRKSGQNYPSPILNSFPP